KPRIVQLRLGPVDRVFTLTVPMMSTCSTTRADVPTNHLATSAPLIVPRTGVMRGRGDGSPLITSSATRCAATGPASGSGSTCAVIVTDATGNASSFAAVNCSTGPAMSCVQSGTTVLLSRFHADSTILLPPGNTPFKCSG